jgi:hypothetical protein
MAHDPHVSRARLAEGYGLPPDYEGEELNVFTPTVILAWNTRYEDATRFTFPDVDG